MHELQLRLRIDVVARQVAWGHWCVMAFHATQPLTLSVHHVTGGPHANFRFRLFVGRTRDRGVRRTACRVNRRAQDLGGNVQCLRRKVSGANP